MKIVFFGEDAFSLLALESLVNANHDILGVFCPVYNNVIYSRLEKYCNQMAIYFERISNFSEPTFVEKIKILCPDLLVICHFQKIIQQDLIDVPKFGSINLHPSLLPNYRGMAPQHWPIINGDKETGVTVHFVDKDVDTGDIIMQHKLLIEDSWYVSDLQNSMKPIYSTIIKDAVDIICKGNHKYFIQRNLEGSYYGRLKISDCHISLDISIRDAHNIVRAVSFPYFGARFEDLIIWKAELFDYKSSEFNSFFDQKIGYFELNTGEKYIKFKDGLLKILKSEKYEKKSN
jgi:methionyl-tRNA formyltransferase